MKYTIDKDILAIRLFEDEDFVASLCEAFRKTGKPLGVILSATGMMKEIKLGFFTGSNGVYEDHSIDTPMEIVSLTGNLINGNDGVLSHFHVSVAGRDLGVQGGHLVNAKIYAAGEIFIRLSDIKAERELEEKTGLKGLKL